MRPRTSRMSNEPLNAGGRELGLKARPPARFSSQPSPERVNQKQVPAGNTLLAQRYLLPGNSYFWHAAGTAFMRERLCRRVGEGRELRRQPAIRAFPGSPGEIATTPSCSGF